MKRFLRIVLALTVLQFLNTGTLRAQEDEEVITVEEEAEPTAAPSKPVDEIEDVVELEVEVDEETPAATEEPTPEPTEEVTPEPTEEPTPEPTEAPAVTERMRDVYERGIDLYQRKRYTEALEELDRACGFKKGSAQAWLFAEAHAMRGIIYQFYLKSSGHLEKAREAYNSALGWDPQNKAAKRHIREVR